MDKKHWRPDGWKKQRETIMGENPHEYDAHFFEAGADAMLSALFKLAKESPTGTFAVDSKVGIFYMEEIR